MHVPSQLTTSLLFALLSTQLASCEESQRDYGIGFYNTTTAEITDIRADWLGDGRGYHDYEGTLATDARCASHEQPRPIPAKIIITWKTADGKVHTKEMEVASHVPDPPRFSGTIYFKFTPDGGVSLVTVSDEEAQKQAEKGKDALREKR